MVKFIRTAFVLWVKIIYICTVGTVKASDTELPSGKDTKNGRLRTAEEKGFNK